MPASEPAAKSPPHRSPRPSPSAFSMRDLLASCAAATAVSTPPGDRGGAARSGQPVSGEPVSEEPVSGEGEPRRDAA
ncbi:hypothetical protein DDQ41_19195 [Streptomyces spongiicola]|uniref:Uncharacterized protein n=1 Tax=Streptomyces spongiicola TaxID=1690221 RepID=A0ABM6VAB4_9ACTN|nr:hypothetical protein [Streptomyces spongiicola]AWK10673.1 hypothetical protein DDQ41_19195 [Streptomyces spongiicola]